MKATVCFDPLPCETPHVPVVIVGAGACGLTAALSLARQNIETLVLERDAQPQGSTALSSGFIPAATACRGKCWMIFYIQAIRSIACMRYPNALAKV